MTGGAWSATLCRGRRDRRHLAPDQPRSTARACRPVWRAVRLLPRPACSRRVARTDADAHPYANAGSVRDPDADARPVRDPTPTPTPLPTPVLPVTEGIDVSHWQNTIDWTQVAASGKRFAYMKASEGTRSSTTYAGNRPRRRPRHASRRLSFRSTGPDPGRRRRRGRLLPGHVPARGRRSAPGARPRSRRAGWRRSSSRNGSRPTSGGSTSERAPAA